MLLKKKLQGEGNILVRVAISWKLNNVVRKDIAHNNKIIFHTKDIYFNNSKKFLV